MTAQNTKPLFGETMITVHLLLCPRNDKLRKSHCTQIKQWTDNHDCLPTSARCSDAFQPIWCSSGNAWPKRTATYCTTLTASCCSQWSFSIWSITHVFDIHYTPQTNRWQPLFHQIQVSYLLSIWWLTTESTILHRTGGLQYDSVTHPINLKCKFTHKQSHHMHTMLV